MASSSSLTGKKVGAAPLSRDQLIDFIQSSISNQQQQEDQDQEMELFYVLDLGAVNSLVESWARHLPMVRPFYAVKCNPSPGLLKQLAALGTGFDCASRAEIRTVLALGVSPDRIVFANTCKPESHLKYAAEVGVNLTTFDSINELEKIRKWHPKSSLLIRIKVPESSGASTVQFGSKFGALPEEIISLLEAARANQLEVIGVSFHIGSRAAIDVQAFEDAIAAAKTTFEAALQLGLPKLHVLNIGGGYASGPTFPDVASAMRASLKKYFPDEPDDHHGLTVMAEPGRFFANTPFTLITTIIGKRVRGEIKEYWINDGIWGSLNFLKCEHDHDDVIFTPLANHGGGCSTKNPTFKGIKTYDSTVYGPTCDPIDTVLKGHQLPELEVNDRLVFHNMGAYTTSRGNDFNGFKTSAIATYFA